MHKRLSLSFGLALFLIIISCSSSVRYSRASSGTSVRTSSSSNKTAPKGKKTTTLNGKRHEVSGVASYYGPGFQGKPTANGERFNMHKMTAAHKTLPFNTKVKVKNIDNGKSVVVRINDRGPFKKGRIIDLSKGAAKKIGMLQSGTANVKLEILN